MCGVVGYLGVTNALKVVMPAMRKMQHRGQQGSGIVAITPSGEVIHHREPRLVENLEYALVTRNLHEEFYAAAIGHLRYGTAGSRDALKNIQPLYGSKGNWEIYLSHNGDTPFFEELKQDLISHDVVFGTDADTEFILKYIGLSQDKHLITNILEGLGKYKGTFALAMLIRNSITGEIMIGAARDWSGNRPLVLGELDREGYIVSSESTAFESVKASFVREVNPGELLIISKRGLKSYDIPNYHTIEKVSSCIFELIYFSHPGAKVFGVPAYKFRKNLGRILGERYRTHNTPEDAIIVNVPDSANYFADGFAEELRKPVTHAIIRNHFFGRSFIEEASEDILREKFTVLGDEIVGKSVVVCDDSLVRGNTARKIVRVVREAGAAWVGFISSAPPIIGPCCKGIDFAKNLVAQKFLSGTEVDVQAIKKLIEADFLMYATKKDLEDAITTTEGNDKSQFCYGCFERREPVFKTW